MHIERLGVADIVGAPDAVDELAAGEHAPRVAHQVLEQVEFLERHRHGRAVDEDGVALDVEADAAAFQNILRLCLGLRLGNVGAAAQHRADTGDEFARGVRLGHVVVRAEFEADNFVDLRVARRDHDDRDVGCRAQLLAHVGSGHAGQHQVKKDEVDVARGEFRKCGLAIGGDERLEALFL